MPLSERDIWKYANTSLGAPKEDLWVRVGAKPGRSPTRGVEARETAQQPLSYQERVMHIRMFPLTQENAQRADLLVAAFPDICSTPFDTTLYRNLIDLMVKLWIKGRGIPSLQSIQQMLAGIEPIACPVRLHPQQRSSRRSP